MPFGRGFGRGFGMWAYGPYGYGGYGAYPFGGRGGRGNPFSFCRNFPWLPRWWWATPDAAQYAATINQPYAPMTKEQDISMLEEQLNFLKDELAQAKSRIAELQKVK